MKRVRVWLAALCCLLLVGCTTRLIYYWLDWVVAWQLDDYFSLSSSQSKVLDRELRGFMVWHRSSEIPRYAKELRQLGKAVASPMSQDQVSQALGQLEEDIDRVIGNALPRAVRLAQLLNDDQLSRFIRERREKLEDKQVAFRLKSRAAMEREFADKMNERLVYWLGSVEPAQQPLVARWVSWQYELYGPWLDYQHQWWNEFASVVRLKGTPDFAVRLGALLTSGDGLMGGRYTGYSQQSRERTVQWLSDLSQSLTLAQRAHLYGLFKGFADDFAVMARTSEH